METTIQLKRIVANTRILCIIIGEFRPWGKSSQVVLFVVDEGPEENLYCNILPFCLPVRLGLKGGRESLLDA